MGNLTTAVLLLALAALVLGAFLLDQFGPALGSNPGPSLETAPVRDVDGSRVRVTIGDSASPGPEATVPEVGVDQDSARRFIETGEGVPDETNLPRNRETGGFRRHIVEPGETLAELARRYLGDTKQWPKIMAANPTLKDPKALRSGSEILIPPRD